MRPFFLVKILAPAEAPFCGRRYRIVLPARKFSRFASRQSIQIAAPVRLLPGMRSSRGSRNSPSRRRNDIRRPDARPDGNRSLARESRADREHQVVAGNQKQRDQKTGGAAAAPGARADRHGQQRKRNAREGKRKAALNFHAGVALRFALAATRRSWCGRECRARKRDRLRPI